MTPLDLSKAPPRGPREKLCGAYFLPRTVDKIRSELPGGNPAGYFVDNPIGMSAYMLEKLNIDLAALRAVVAEAANEREIAAWISANADLPSVEATNTKMAAVTVGSSRRSRRARQRKSPERRRGSNRMVRKTGLEPARRCQR